MGLSNEDLCIRAVKKNVFLMISGVQANNVRFGEKHPIPNFRSFGLVIANGQDFKILIIRLKSGIFAKLYCGPTFFHFRN